MSNIYLIDYYANSIKSPFQRAAVYTKIFFLLLILAAIIITNSPRDLIIIFTIIILLAVISKLPLSRLVKWALYPAFFASMFALSQIQYGLLPLITMLKAVNAALLMILIISTTPYPNIFSLIGRVSAVLGNVSYISYRYFFLLVDEMQTKIRTMKARGGYTGGIFLTLRNVGSMIGQLLIHSLERSEKLYGIMLIRGFRGKMYSKVEQKFSYFDIFLLLVSLAVLFYVIRL